MAVKPCPECGKPVSSTADACPHCGGNLPSAAKTLMSAGCSLMVISIVLIFVILALAGGC